MKPGLTTWPCAWISRAAVPSNFPTSTIFPSATATSPLNGAAPVPSTINALRIAKVGLLIISLAFEFCRTFFQERAHAFIEIRGAAGLALHLPFEVELLLVGVLVAVPVELANQAERNGGAARE